MAEPEEAIREFGGVIIVEATEPNKKRARI